MRARRMSNGAEFRLLQDEREIGSVDPGAVRFHGFSTRSDAALAASVAYRALALRRGERARPADEAADILIVNHESTELVVARSAILARLLEPSPEDPASGWGFEVELYPDEAFEVFAIARARLMWRALSGTPVGRRMLQFRERASVELAPTTNRV
jgi:hypothetical protein